MDQSVSQLLELPLELVRSIASQLKSDPQSFAALLLTCKALFHILKGEVPSIQFRVHEFPNVRRALPRAGGLVPLLEKDLGHEFFFCSGCCRFHRFLPSWDFTTIRTRESIAEHKHNLLLCHMGPSFNPGGGWSTHRAVYFDHARLVMNRHFYGAPNGLPPESLAWDGPALRGCFQLEWNQSATAKIIGDELFLRITHTLEGPANLVADELYMKRYEICDHVSTHTAGCLRWPNNWTAQSLLALVVWPAKSLLACRDMPGSCNGCLTDYTTTVEPTTVEPEGPVHYWVSENGLQNVVSADGTSTDLKNETLVGLVRGGCRITITAYHALGRCRYADDRMWASLTHESWKRDFRRGDRDKPYCLYPPGAVEDKWRSSASH